MKKMGYTHLEAFKIKIISKVIIVVKYLVILFFNLKIKFSIDKTLSIYMQYYKNNINSYDYSYGLKQNFIEE